MGEERNLVTSVYFGLWSVYFICILVLVPIFEEEHSFWFIVIVKYFLPHPTDLRCIQKAQAIVLENPYPCCCSAPAWLVSPRSLSRWPLAKNLNCLLITFTSLYMRPHVVRGLFTFGHWNSMVYCYHSWFLKIIFAYPH